MEVLAGTAYVKVAAPDGWVRGKRLLVCAIVETSDPIGFLPMPNGGYITSKTQLSIEKDTTVPTGSSSADTPPDGPELVVVRMSRPERDERGAVAILFAAVAVILFILAAMVVDLGLARDTKRASQNAADASALAAANALYPASGLCSNNTSSANGCIADAVAAAKSYAAVNFGVTTADWSDCPTTLTGFVSSAGTPTCIGFDTLTKPTKVAAVMPTRNLKTGLGIVAGVDNIPISTDAQARSMPACSVKCGLCFLGSIGTTKFNASVSPGGIAVNGSVQMSGNGSQWTAATIAYTGTFDSDNKINESVPATKIPPFEDPWKNKTGVPPAVTGSAKPANTNPCTGGPGIYGDYEFKNACTFTTGGLYVITGDWTWKNVTVTATPTGGATFYFTCGTTGAPVVCNGTAGGSMDTKNGDLRLNAPTTGVRAGLGIIYDRKNTSPLLLQGNGSSAITGAVYAPA